MAENENKGIRLVDIDQEMQQSYLDYAMSVIISRALPDARDGLKPVQRRILYAMYDMGIRPDSSYKKSARIVGEVLGKYHPHGDSAVYEAMARLAQDFSIRYPLVEGQGNFGSIDGDPPAAMRYTEARLDQFSMELLNHIDQATVDFTPNFDGTLEEPVVLPSIVPNMLVNGASGIAVGMATNIPPHNLGEIIDALIYILQNWETYEDISVEDLMRYVKGPDFPTGGIVILEDARNELVMAYATGRGKLTVRGRVHLEDMGRGRNRLIISEIPYQINKSGLIERIAQLVRDSVVEGITDLRDESDRQGMRIVIELSKAGDPEKILRQLYKHTPLQTTFGIILLALAGNKPRVLSLKQSLRIFLDHQLEVTRRKTEFELDKAEKRAHILEALLIAIRNLDEIIRIIREAENEAQARNEIMMKFELDQVQAQAILDMPLKRLTHLEHDKIMTEYQALQETIAQLKALLASPSKMRDSISGNLAELKKRYADARRTQIALLGEGVSSGEALTADSLVQAEDVWVGITADGKIGRVELEKIKEKGFKLPQLIARSNTQHTAYFATENGKAFGIYVETLPKVEQFDEGISLSTVTGWTGKEKAVVLFTLSASDVSSNDCCVITVSENGLLKKSLAAEVPFASTQSFTLCKINEGDKLLTVLVSNGEEDILLASRGGMAIRFDQSGVRAMGLIAAGVNGMKLKENDRLCGAILTTETQECCFLTTEWGLNRIPVSDFPKQGRYGLGVIVSRLPDGTEMSAICPYEENKALYIIRFGKDKVREVGKSLIKPLRRSKAIEPLVKRNVEPAAGLNILVLSPKRPMESPQEESDLESKPADQTPEKNDRTSSNPRPEDPAAAPDSPADPTTPKQFSLF